MVQPDLILVPFAANAPAANVDVIPVTLGPSDPPQAASWAQGFPQVTMTPLAAGGIPPRGQSFNGVLQDITEHLVYIGGGGQYQFSSAYVTENGGYAIGAILQSDNGLTSYRSAVNLNTKNFNTDPSSIGIEWIPYAGAGAIINWSNISGKPTTIAGYGITDAYTKTQSDAQIASVRTDITTALSLKADKATTYTITQTDALLTAKADKSTTLTGYGIVLPTQPQAEAGADNTLPMTPLRVAQYVATKIVQATQLVAGILRFGTQAEVNAGASAALAVSAATLAGRLDSGLFSSASGLRISTAGTNGQADISAASVFVNSSTGRGKYVSASVTISITNSGNFGLDSGTPAANTWYYVWVIHDGSTTAAVLSLSSSAPTMPSGYTMSARVGTVRTGSSATVLLPTLQAGRVVRYKVTPGTGIASLPIMVSGVQGVTTGATPTFVAVATGAFAPPTATKIGLILSGYCNSNAAIAAPNNNYAGSTPSSQSTPLFISQGASANTQLSATADFVLESTNVYYASAASPSGLSCTGWEE